VEFFQFIAHLDEHLLALSQQYGNAAYVILFLIIFSETGLIIAPLLPGDSLLFVAGALAALSGGNPAAFNLPTLLVLLSLAAFLGNVVNYQIGRWLGPKVFHWPKSRLFNPVHLREAHDFYERHGGKTIVISRFLPFIRTFAPFVAGVGEMPRARFLAFNAAGAVLWVVSLVLAGYFFGNVPAVKGNLTLAIAVIVLITLLPLMAAGIRARFGKR
jgi:membrane-associated protein